MELVTAMKSKRERIPQGRRRTVPGSAAGGMAQLTNRSGIVLVISQA